MKIESQIGTVMNLHITDNKTERVRLLDVSKHKHTGRMVKCALVRHETDGLERFVRIHRLQALCRDEEP